MNRIIKFRCWSVNLQEMFTPESIPNSICDPDGDPYEEEHFVHLEYTGLKDKNGADIFEGDIVSDGKTVFVVEWSHHLACWWLNPVKSLIGEDWILLHLDNQPLGNGYLSRKDLEVIGNKFQNPELLKEV